MSNAELATSYAALILADDGVDVTVRILHLRIPASLNATGMRRNN
jgi:hypothetical protein